MVRHIVMFRLNGSKEERYEAASKFKAALEKLPQIITVLRSIEVGINSNPAEQWDVVLNTTFDNMEDLNTYATHPDHVAAAKLLSQLKEARACVDYEY